MSDVQMTFIANDFGLKNGVCFFWDHRRHLNEKQQYKAIASDKLILSKQKLNNGATVVCSVLQNPDSSHPPAFMVKTVTPARSPRSSAFASKLSSELDIWRASIQDKIEYLLVRFQEFGTTEAEFVKIYQIVYGTAFAEDAKCFGYDVLGFDGVFKSIKTIVKIEAQSNDDAQSSSSETEGSESDGSDEGSISPSSSPQYRIFTPSSRKRWASVPKFKLTEARYTDLKGINVTIGKRGNGINPAYSSNGRALNLPPMCWGHYVFTLRNEDQVNSHLASARNFDKASGFPIILGLDTEWLPEFGETHSKTSVLQIAFSSHCFIIQLLHLEKIPRILAEILADPTIFKTGHDISHDALRLQQDYGLQVNGLLELRDLESQYGCPRKSLAGAYEHVFQTPMPKDKRVTLSNWERFTLSEQQIAYAALDAIASRSILFEFYLQFGHHRKSFSPSKSTTLATTTTITTTTTTAANTTTVTHQSSPAEFEIGWDFRNWVEIFC